MTFDLSWAKESRWPDYTGAANNQKRKAAILIFLFCIYLGDSGHLHANTQVCYMFHAVVSFFFYIKFLSVYRQAITSLRPLTIIDRVKYHIYHKLDYLT